MLSLLQSCNHGFDPIAATPLVMFQKSNLKHDPIFSDRHTATIGTQSHSHRDQLVFHQSIGQPRSKFFNKTPLNNGLADALRELNQFSNIVN